MKRKIALLLTLGLSLNLLTGCGGNTSTGSADNESANGGDTMSIMVSGTESDAYTQGIKKVIE